MIYQAYNLSPNQEMFDFSIPSSIKINEDTEVTAETKGTRLIDKTYSFGEKYRSVTIPAGTIGYYYKKTADDETYLIYLDGTQEEGTYYVLNQDKIDRRIPKKLPEQYSATDRYFYCDSCYERPFSFYINGTTNLLGLRVKIYNNINNELCYDSGIIQKGDIKTTKEKNLIIYNISPSSTGAQINLAPLGARGEEIRIDLSLPIAPKGESFVNKIINEPNVSMYWVLTQYYSFDNTGALDLTQYVENAPSLLFPRQKPCLALRYYHQGSDGSIKWADTLDELTKWPYRDISVKVMPCFFTDEKTASPVLGDYFKTLPKGGVWSVIPYDNSEIDESGIEEEEIQGSILDYSFSRLVSSPELGKVRSYKIALIPTYLGDNLSDYDLRLVKTEEGTGAIALDESRSVDVVPQYEITNLKDILNFRAEVCNNKNYVELLWNKALHLGIYYDSKGNPITAGLLAPYYIDYGEYNAGLGVVPRTLTSIYLPEGNKLVYDDLDIEGGNNQVYLRFNNKDNLLGTFCKIQKEDGSSISLNFVKQDGKIVLQIEDGNTKKIPTFTIEGAANTPIECDDQTWQTIGLNLNSIVADKVFLLNYGVTTNGAELLSENARNCILYPSENVEGAFVGNPNGSKNYGINGNSLIEYKTEGEEYGLYLENQTVPFYPQNVLNIVGSAGIKLPSGYEKDSFLLLKDDGDNKKGYYIWEADKYVFSHGPEVGKIYTVPHWRTEGVHSDYYMLFQEDLGQITRVCENYFFPGAPVTKDSTSAWGINIDSIESIPEIITSTTSQGKYKEIEFSNCALDYVIIGDLSQKGLGEASLSSWKTHFTTILKTSLLPIYKVEKDGGIITYGEPNREDLGVDFLANYDKELSASQAKLNGETIEYWRIDRSDFLGKHREIALLPAECGAIKDYSVNNNWKGHYEITPVSSNYIGETVYYGYPSEMSTNWWNYSLLVLGDEDENGNRPVETAFYWNLNATTGDITNNTAFNVQETLSRFKRVSKSQTNAISGSLQSLVGYSENGEYHGDAIEVINKLYEIQMSDKVKVLKDRNGRNYVIEFTGPITFTQDNNACINTTYSYNGYSKPVSIQPSTIKINWIEVGKFEDIKAIEILD